MSNRQRATVGRTYHKEEIRCPECSSHQIAEVEHTKPFYNFVHECTSCGTWIQESEWEPTIQNHRSPEIEDQECSNLGCDRGLLNTDTPEATPCPDCWGGIRRRTEENPFSHNL